MAVAGSRTAWIAGRLLIGHWEWTDAGWSWASDEPWGYATYHYGRWFVDARQGWVWLPGTTYAPAWVAWRSGGGYVGWAPLGPTVSEAEVHVTEYHTRNIPAVQFTFVEEKKITDRKIIDRAVKVEKNTTIINKTTNITNINIENKVVVNKSLSVEQVEKVTGKKVKPVTEKVVTDPGEAKRLQAKGELVIYKPAVLESEHEKALRASRGGDRRDQRLEAKREAGSSAPIDAEKRASAEKDKAEEARREREEAEKSRQAAIKREEAEKARVAEMKRQEEAERVRWPRSSAGSRGGVWPRSSAWKRRRPRRRVWRSMCEQAEKASGRAGEA
jgi:hypothetical protein